MVDVHVPPMGSERVVHGASAAVSAHGNRRVSKRAVVALAAFTFWTQFKPSEPFLVGFFIDVKGLSNGQVFNDVFPLFTYAKLPCLLLIGFLSELPCGNVGLLVLAALSGSTTSSLTLLGGLLAVQASQFTEALCFAGRTAVNSLAFVIAAPGEEQQTIHILKGVLLASNAGSALLGEILRDGGVSLSLLFAMAVAAQALAVVCAGTLCAMGVETSKRPLHALNSNCRASVVASISASWRTLRAYLSLRRIRWWTAWTLCTAPMHSLVLTYWQSLLRAKGVNHDHNGYITACMYLFAAWLTVLARKVKIFRSYCSALVIGSLALAGGLLVLMAAQTSQIPIYACLLAYHCVHEVATAVSISQIGNAALREGADGNHVERASQHDDGISQAFTGEQVADPQDESLRPQRNTSGTGKLTLLFAAEEIAGGIVEVAMQACLDHVDSVPYRFYTIGSYLAGAAALMLLGRLLGALIP